MPAAIGPESERVVGAKFPLTVVEPRAAPALAALAVAAPVAADGDKVDVEDDGFGLGHGLLYTNC